MKKSLLPIPRSVFREHNSPLSHLFWSGERRFAEARKEVKWIINAAKLKKGDRILDLGCGNGRHAIAFARRGIDVVGVDCCRRQIKLAHKNARKLELKNRVRFIKADMRTFRSLGPYHAVVMLGNGASCLYNSNDFQKFIRHVFRLIMPGGYFFFDAFHHAEMLHRCRVKRDWNKSDAHTYRLIEREYDSKKGVYKGSLICVSNGKIIVSHRIIPVLKEGEIIKICRNAGFSVEHKLGSFLGEPFAGRNSLLALTLKKSIT